MKHITNVIPFIGTELYKLGEHFEEMQKRLGPNIQIIENAKGKRIIDGAFSLKFLDDKVLEFSVLEIEDLYFQQQKVFTETFATYLKDNYEHLYKFGFLIFPEIGIAINGFAEKEETKTITVFQKGGWDHILKL